MAKSAAFARIRRDVLAIMAAVPPGRLVTYRDVGRHLDVVPRHVAYILSTLDPGEKELVPWFRAVGDDGSLGVPKADGAGLRQEELLEAEGVRVGPDRRVVGLANHLVATDDLDSGVPRQVRPTAGAAPRRP